jgi:hypothetical protein
MNSIFILLYLLVSVGGLIFLVYWFGGEDPPSDRYKNGKLFNSSNKKVSTVK